MIVIISLRVLKTNRAFKLTLSKNSKNTIAWQAEGYHTKVIAYCHNFWLNRGRIGECKYLDRSRLCTTLQAVLCTYIRLLHSVYRPDVSMQIHHISWNHTSTNTLFFSILPYHRYKVEIESVSALVHFGWMLLLLWPELMLLACCMVSASCTWNNII